MRAIEKEYKTDSGIVRISYLDETPIQIVWEANALKDDDDKVRCREGFTHLRLWERGDSCTLSQGIKAMMGAGDLPVKSGLDKDAVKNIHSLEPDEIVAALFNLKGDITPIERAWSCRK